MSIFNSHLRTELPPLTVPKNVRDSPKWKEAVMDAFESIALVQFRENEVRYGDFYRMFDNTLSYTELRQMAPHLKEITDILDKADLPSYIRHWDIIGILIKTLVGKLIDMQDKYHVTDTGEIAESEFLRFKDEEIQSEIIKIIQQRIKIGLAKKGLDAEGKQFSTPEEQQQYLAQLQAEQENLTPKDTQRDSNKTFKTIGVQWGEATIEKDKEDFELDDQYKELFKQYLLSGVCAKIIKTFVDYYKPITWDSREVFHSRDTGKKFLQDFQYAGRLHYPTPSQVVEEYGHLISQKDQKTLLGGDTTWRNIFEAGFATGTPQQVIDNNFHASAWVPYKGYHNQKFMEKIEDISGLPMGVNRSFNSDGSVSENPMLIPRNTGTFANYGNVRSLETRFNPSKDTCQVTEVYFRVMEPLGWLTYETESGSVETEMITEDILPEFLKEKGIKQLRNLNYVEMVKDFEVNTVVWQLRPVVYEGVKVQSQNLKSPMYLICDRMENQIYGLSDTDVKLPVTGRVGTSLAKGIEPYQQMFNYAMNQVRSLSEKELGMFFIMDVLNIPSEYETGNAQDSFMMLRNAAKTTGIMPVTNSVDGIGNGSIHNMFSTHNLSHASEINTRIQIAEHMQIKAYQTVGINPVQQTQDRKYVTETGVKLSNEATNDQIAYIYDDFNAFIKLDLQQHLSVAQFAQSNNMDKSLFYTKSDASISWLKLSDPSFPLRRIGLVVTADSKKRKELESIKQALINNNTIGADSLELGRLIGSDAFTEVMDIAKQERAVREEKEQLMHQRQMEQLQAQGQNIEQSEQKKWERQEISKERDRQNKLQMQEIEAYGRAADKDSNKETFDLISRAAEDKRKDTRLIQDYETQLRSLDIKEQDLIGKRAKAVDELTLRMKELELREKQIESNEYVAGINKN